MKQFLDISYKIERRYLTPTLRIKATYPTHNPKIENKKIDELEQKVDDIVSKILYANPETKISNKTIDDEILKQSLPIDIFEDDNLSPFLYDFNSYIKTNTFVH